MTPRIRFTITEATVAPEGIIVREPIGWKDCTLVLERHPEFYSLVEYFEGDFIWIGRAFLLLQEIKRLVGPDAEVEVLIEISYKIGRWEEIFDGLIDLPLSEVITKKGKPYKIKAAIIRNDRWAKFINRRVTPVDLKSTVDLDGNAIDPASSITLPLPSQKIRQTYRKSTSVEYSPDYPTSLVHEIDLTDGNPDRTLYLLFGTPVDEVNELGGKQTYDPQISTSNPVDDLKYIFKTQYGGEYLLNSHIYFRVLFDERGGNTDPSGTVDISWYYVTKINGVLSAPIQIGTTESSIFPSPTIVDFNITGDKNLVDLSLSLNVSDEIYIYGVMEIESTWGAGGNFRFDLYLQTDGNPISGGIQTSLELVGDTEFEDTETEAFLIKEAFRNTLSKIVGEDIFTSASLDPINCRGKYSVMLGHHIRGNALLNRPFVRSFNNLWEGAHPMLALGFGYTNDGGFEIESIESFLVPVNSTILTKISSITPKYDNKQFIKLFEYGFQDWSAESSGGIDDPQTKKYVRPILKTIGEVLTKYSKFYAASLGIEEARRKRVEVTKDYRLDEKIIVIAVKPDGDDYTPEVGADFEEITDLLNSAERYNVRLFCSRILKRWLRYISSGLQQTDGTLYHAGGEGNLNAKLKLSAEDCESAEEDTGDGLAENDDVSISTVPSKLPEIFDVSGAMTWAQYRTIQQARKNSIGVYYDGEVRNCFIETLRFKHFDGNHESVVVESGVRTRIFDDSFDETFE